MSSCSRPSRPGPCSPPATPPRPKRKRPVAAREAKFFLNSYVPLVETAYGREAASRHDLPPFIDGAIRREPDLEHRYPSISCLCRRDKFAPRLLAGDVVMYITRKGRYRSKHRHWRATTVLHVEQTFDSHAAAAEWYEGEGLTVPSNCMVAGNPSAPISHSHRLHVSGHLDDARLLHTWDRGYAARAQENGCFVVCKPIWRCLDWTAPEIQEDDFRAVFDRVPGTRNPGAWPISYLPKLARRLRVDVPPYAE